MLINIHEAKTHFSQLIEKVQSGEEVIIGKNGKPVAKLIAYIPSKNIREMGLWKNKIEISHDFDITPLDIIEDFESNIN